MAQRTADELLATILNCGSSDIPFLLKEEESFDVDIWDYVTENRTNAITYNELIYEIYRQALENAGFDFDLHGDKYEIFTNHQDSHFIIDGETCLDAEDVKNAVAKLNGESENETDK